MNKFSIYILLIFIYLAIDKGLQQSQGTVFNIQKNADLGLLSESFPLNIILIDSFPIGLIITSYYHTYKLVYGFKAPDIVTIQVNHAHYEQNQKHIGHVLFTRFDNQLENYLITPPGTGFIGNKKYGHWVENKDVENFWAFNENYSNLTRDLGLENVFISERYFQQLKIYLEKNLYYSQNKDWEMKGPYIKNLASKKMRKNNLWKVDWHYLLNKFFKIPRWQMNS